jgi:hypothetical protein
MGDEDGLERGDKATAPMVAGVIRLQGLIAQFSALRTL